MHSESLKVQDCHAIKIIEKKKESSRLVYFRSFIIRRASPFSTLVCQPSPAHPNPKQFRKSQPKIQLLSLQNPFSLLRFAVRRRKSHPNPSSRTKSTTSTRTQIRAAHLVEHSPRQIGSNRKEAAAARCRPISRLRRRCSTAASAASPRSTASLAPTSSAASRGSAPTRPASTRTNSSPPPPVRLTDLTYSCSLLFFALCAGSTLMLRVVARLILLWRQGDGDKGLDKVGERLQGVSISTADGSSSTGHLLVLYDSII